MDRLRREEQNRLEDEVEVAKWQGAKLVLARLQYENMELIKLLREHGIAIPKHLTGEAHEKR